MVAIDKAQNKAYSGGMEKINLQISPNFTLAEFNQRRLNAHYWAMPLASLLHVVQKLRERIGSPVKITDGARTVEAHIELYKKLHGDAWQDKITWNSKHLCAWDDPLVVYEGLPYKALCAVDVKCRNDGVDFEKNVDKSVDNLWITGGRMASIVHEVVKSKSFNELFPDCFWGVGVGKNFIHLDTGPRRQADAVWAYDY